MAFKLKKTPNKTESTPGRGSLMDEMQKNLAKRRAKVDSVGEESDETKNKSASPASTASTASWSRAGSESPKTNARRRTFGSGELEKDIKVNGVNKNANANQLQNMKEEILKEMKNEVKKAKDEIIDFIREEFSKR